MKKTLSVILAVILMLSLAVVAYAATAAGDTIVYRTASGSKYHKEGCSSLKGNGIEITLAEAVEKGLEPCTKCNPPTLDPNAASGTSSTSAAAATAVAAETPAKTGPLSNPLITFIIGIVVGAFAITLVRGFILQAQDAAEAAEEDSEE